MPFNTLTQCPLFVAMENMVWGYSGCIGCIVTIRNVSADITVELRFMINIDFEVAKNEKRYNLFSSLFPSRVHNKLLRNKSNELNRFLKPRIEGNKKS